MLLSLLTHLLLNIEISFTEIASDVYILLLLNLVQLDFLQILFTDILLRGIFKIHDEIHLVPLELEISFLFFVYLQRRDSTVLLLLLKRLGSH